MTMHAATMLRFVKFPSVSNRPQQTVDGRAWQIVQVEAPFCWARPHGSSEPLRQYLVQGEQLFRAATGPPAQARPGDGVRARGGIRTDAGAARAGRSAALSKASQQVRLHRYGSECDCIGRSRPARLSHCGAARRHAWAASSVLRNQPGASGKRRKCRSTGNKRRRFRLRRGGDPSRKWCSTKVLGKFRAAWTPPMQSPPWLSAVRYRWQKLNELPISGTRLADGLGPPAGSWAHGNI